MNSEKIILVSEPMSEKSLAFLDSIGKVIRCEPEQVPNYITDADALVVRTYTQVDEKLLAIAKRLKVVARAGVALENIDIPACRKRGIEVVHTPEANTLAVVDYTIAHIIKMNRRFRQMDSFLTAEQFHAERKHAFGRFLASATLGIIGLGRIGSRVGRIADAMGMNVIYNDILTLEPGYPARAVTKDDLYAKSDIITIHVPLNEQTKKFINADAIAKFKKPTQFINAARGQCVDYYALAEGIKSGRISAATIDCHDPEPPPKNYPMFDLGENVTLTPHTAARVPEAMERMCDVVQDVAKILDGEKPKFPAPE